MSDPKITFNEILNDNFGHKNIFYKSPVPIRKINHPKLDNDPTIPVPPNYEELVKQNILDFQSNLSLAIAMNKVVPLEKDYLTLTKHIIDVTYSRDEQQPCLVLSLFLPASKMNGSLDLEWVYGYLLSAFKCIAVWKYHFSKGNIRIYLCQYLIDYFKKLDANALFLDNIRTRRYEPKIVNQDVSGTILKPARDKLIDVISNKNSDEYKKIKDFFIELQPSLESKIDPLNRWTKLREQSHGGHINPPSYKHKAELQDDLFGMTYYDDAKENNRIDISDYLDNIYEKLTTDKIAFNNAYEKLIYCYTTISRYYRPTKGSIQNAKDNLGDACIEIFSYKINHPAFIENINGVEAHISDN